jgi:hypothetical protein
MFAEVTTHGLAIAGGLTATMICIFALAAMVLAEAQRLSWGRDRWASFEREALRQLTGREAGMGRTARAAWRRAATTRPAWGRAGLARSA